MKPFILVAALLVSACSLPLGTSNSPGKVTISVGSASTGSPAPSRFLSASTDIVSMAYQVTDLTGGEAPRTGSLSADQPVVTLSLTAGHTYEVAVVVTPTSTVPGATTGVKTFGDSALVTPVAGETQVVPLWVRPFDTLAFQNYVPDLAVSAWDPATAAATSNLGFQYSTSGDYRYTKFRYGARGELYYVAGSSPTIYQWGDTSNPLDTELDSLVSITSVSGIQGDQRVVTPDPLVDHSFYVVGIVENMASPSATLYHVITYPGQSGKDPEVAQYWDITDSLYGGYNSTYKPSVTATALAVNPLTRAVYVSSWAFGSYNDNSDDNRVRSAIHRFDVATATGAGESVPAAAVYGDTDWFDATGSQSIWRDLMFRGGELLALGGPAINEGNSTTYDVGTATVLRLSPNLVKVGALGAPSSHTYTADSKFSESPATTGGQLGYPLSFATGGHGATVYVNQDRYISGSHYEVMTENNLLTGEGQVRVTQLIASQGG